MNELQPSRMRILFVLPRMVSGGVERITLTLAARFIAAGHTCELALRRKEGDLLAEAEALMPVTELAPSSLLEFLPALARTLRAQQPTHVITAFSDVAALTWIALKLAGSPAALVHGVHNTHSRVIARPGAMGALRHWLESRFAAFTYRHADAIVAVSEGVRQEVLQGFGVPPQRVTTIYNPVLSDAQLAAAREPGAGEGAAPRARRLVAVGRLTRQKGFDILVEALARVPKTPAWHLDIWGEGPERPALEASIRLHRLQDFVSLRGYTADPLAAMRAADLYLLSSRHEGLPTVLIEALACGPQIIAADCPHGPREILLEGELGRLVPPEDAGALAAAIADFLLGKHRVSPERLLGRARDFGADTAASRWLQLLVDLPGAPREGRPRPESTP